MGGRRNGAPTVYLLMLDLRKPDCHVDLYEVSSQ